MAEQSDNVRKEKEIDNKGKSPEKEQEEKFPEKYVNIIQAMVKKAIREESEFKSQSRHSQTANPSGYPSKSVHPSRKPERSRPRSFQKRGKW